MRQVKAVGIVTFAIFQIAILATAYGQEQVAERKTPEQILREADYLVHIEVTVAKPGAVIGGYHRKNTYLSGFLYQPENETRWFVITASHLKPLTDDWHISRIRIYLHNQRQLPYDAGLLGYDRRIDTAVLMIIDPNFNFSGRTAVLGDSDDVAVRDLVVSLGSPQSVRYRQLSGRVQNIRFEETVIDGSGNALPYRLSFIRHGTNIFHGNSGGPLVNEFGEIIGMNTAAFFRPGRAAAEYGLAIPINDIKEILENLIAGEKYD